METLVPSRGLDPRPRAFQARALPTELRRRNWSGRRDSNPQPRPWRGRTHPSAPRPQKIAARIVKERKNKKTRSSCESPGFVVLPRMTLASRHRHPPGDKVVLLRSPHGARKGAREPVRSWIRHRFNVQFAFHLRFQNNLLRIEAAHRANEERSRQEKVDGRSNKSMIRPAVGYLKLHSTPGTPRPASGRAALPRTRPTRGATSPHRRPRPPSRAPAPPRP